MKQIHVGRQPIYDQALQIVGYELLFRPHSTASAAAAAGPFDDEAATSTVIVNVFSEFGLANLVGNRDVFLNLTRSFLVGDTPLPVPAAHVVLEILETVACDDEVLDACKRLKSSGYRLAVDDYAATPDQQQFLPLADYVKIDVQQHSAEALEHLIAQVAPYDVELVAERVETEEHLTQARALKFHYYQGWLLARPVVVSGASLAPSETACLNLLSQLSAPDATVAQIEAQLRLEARLVYRLLRVVNSAGTGVSRQVDSIRDAVVLLGLNQIRAWVLLLVLADGTDTGGERLTLALTRARTCELLARRCTGDVPDVAFTVGLLSSLDMLLGRPLPEILGDLPLTEDVRDALLAGAGSLGRLLTLTLAQERADGRTLLDAGIEPYAASRAYLEALGWSMRTYDQVTAGD